MPARPPHHPSGWQGDGLTPGGNGASRKRSFLWLARAPARVYHSGTVPTPPPLPAPEREPSRDQLELELQNAKAIIRALRQSQEPMDVTPVPETQPSVRKRRAAVAKFLGKAAGLLVFAPFLGAAVAKRWPEYSDLVDVLLGVVGLR